MMFNVDCYFWRLAPADYGWPNGEGSPLEPIQQDILPAAFLADDTQSIVVQIAVSLFFGVER